MSQTNEYPSLGTPPAGSIRFNTDSSKMEIYNGEAWWEIDSTSPVQQTGATRGVLMVVIVQQLVLFLLVDMRIHLSRVDFSL